MQSQGVIGLGAALSLARAHLPRYPAPVAGTMVEPPNRHTGLDRIVRVRVRVRVTATVAVAVKVRVRAKPRVIIRVRVTREGLLGRGYQGGVDTTVHPKANVHALQT